MPKLTSDHATAAERKALAASPDVQALVLATAGDPPPSVAKFVGDLALLRGIPFANLVPHAAMLPVETIRFFYVDPNWIDALIDGAASIGGSDSLQSALQGLLLGALQESARTEAGITAPIASGFLLRSSLVSTYPRLVVTAYSDPAGTQPLTNLRLEKVAPEVMIGLFDGAMALLDIQQPPEGMQFGFVDSGKDDGTLKISLRGLGGDFQSGKEIKQQVVVNGCIGRSGDPDGRVVDILQLQNLLQSKLVHFGALPDGTTFGPASFAVQLVKGAEAQSFKANDAATATTPTTPRTTLAAADVNLKLFGR